MPYPLLAEISDKMMSWPTLLGWNVGLIVLAWAIAKVARWLVVIPFLLAGVLALSAIDELRDRFVGPAVVHELGYGYVALSFLPVIFVVVIAVRTRKRSPASSA
jgi:hypothetical protein